MIQTQENGKKPHFGPHSGFFSKIELLQSLDIMGSYRQTRVIS